MSEIEIIDVRERLVRLETKMDTILSNILTYLQDQHKLEDIQQKLNDKVLVLETQKTTIYATAILIAAVISAVIDLFEHARMLSIIK